MNVRLCIKWDVIVYYKTDSFNIDTARSNIPALGYVGTYAIANVLLTLAGTLIVIIWPGLQ